MFAVIACKPQFPSYLSALLPQDQIFETDQDFQFEPTPVKKKKEQKTEETEEGMRQDLQIKYSIISTWPCYICRC